MHALTSVQDKGFVHDAEKCCYCKNAVACLYGAMEAGGVVQIAGLLAAKNGCKCATSVTIVHPAWLPGPTLGFASIVTNLNNYAEKCRRRSCLKSTELFWHQSGIRKYS